MEYPHYVINTRDSSIHDTIEHLPIDPELGAKPEVNWEQNREQGNFFITPNMTLWKSISQFFY